MVLDLLGTFAFALSGAVSGVKHRLDIFGVLVLSFTAANVGGITRDLLDRRGAAAGHRGLALHRRCARCGAAHVLWGRARRAPLELGAAVRRHGARTVCRHRRVESARLSSRSAHGRATRCADRHWWRCGARHPRVRSPRRAPRRSVRRSPRSPAQRSW